MERVNHGLRRRNLPQVRWAIPPGVADWQEEAAALNGHSPDPPGQAYTLVVCLVVVLLALELLIGILPEDWRRRVNRVRFGPKWPDKE